MDISRGTALVLLGVALFVTTMTVGAVTAPDRDFGGDGSHVPATPGGTTVPVGQPATDAPGTGGATPPSDGDGTATDASGPEGPATLVGMQGEWLGRGSVFLLDGHREVWREDTAGGYFEVTMLENGSVLAAFAEDEIRTDCGPYEPPCARTGYRVIEPDAPNGPEIVSEYSFSIRRVTNREVHAADATDDGGIVFVDMDRERVVLVENGTEVWQWNASSFYDAPVDPTARDWLHMNDVDALGDGRFLVSVRNANQILLLERGEGVVEVINEDRNDADDDVCTGSPELADFDGDGDVRCGDPDVINHQHNPQWLGDGAVLVADSDNDRVVELHRDEDGAWEPVWALHEAGGLRFDWPRDADRLPNGNTLVADSLNRRIVEVAPDGTAVWGAGTDRIPYEADRLPFGELTGEFDGTGGSPTDADPGGDTPTGAPETDDGRTTPTATPDGPPSPTPTVEPLPKLTADDPDAINRTGQEIPILSLGAAGLQGVSPVVPFWFGEFELGMTVLSLGSVLGGVGHGLWRRYRG